MPNPQKGAEVSTITVFDESDFPTLSNEPYESLIAGLCEHAGVPAAREAIAASLKFLSPFYYL